MVKRARRPIPARCAGAARAARAARALVCLLPALAAASCGMSGCPAGRPGDTGTPAGAGAEATPVAAAPEPSMDEQEILAYLRENPGDPSRAGLEQLLSAPSLSEDSASRGDYRRDDDCRSAGAACRLTRRMAPSPGAGESDAYLAAEAPGWKALCRARKTESGGSAASWYITGEALSRAVRFHAGAMVPDFALGLVFGGANGSSLSSGAFPFHAARTIAGTTSFSGQSLQGGAVEIRGRFAYAAAFCGRRARYGSGGPEFEATTAGARIEARRGRGEAGLSVSNGAAESGERIVAVDGRWRSDEINAGFEAVVVGSRMPAVLSAFSREIDKTRAGLLLYIVPAGAGGAFGSLIGRSPGSVSSLGGAAAAVERAFRGRIRLRASLDRWERADGSQSTVRQSARIELERRGAAALLRIVWSGAADERQDVIPYPAAADNRSRASHVIGVQAEWRASTRARLGVALKRIAEDDGLGWLVAPVLRIRLLSERLRVTASLARYATPYGDPVCYFYEPSLQGSFPLRAVSRDTGRGAVVIGLYINRLSVLAHVTAQRGRAPELSLQAAARL